ncbi:unnamed protein product [Sphenostylis stenocarpa]|uniref:Peptidase A1 domain-containing protein n=1 Tax=Sphenostylis stenocarpa TaxID=92480 RepID=A0AA86W3V8_9FABA|nr:unnamed protein product [Sphenostylis stenocarpa]
MTIMSDYSYLVLLFLCLCNLSSSEAIIDGFSVEIIHRDSSKSPFYRSTETQFQRTANALSRSIIRVNHFNQSFVSQNTLQAPVTSAPGEYLVKYSVGSPPLPVYGIVDTGSDITWLQCQPCIKSYKQITPIFDPSKSKTYKTIPCTSSTCRLVQGTSCPSATSNCVYTIDYADETHSQGDLSEETLTLLSTNGSPIQIPRIAFGCGHINAVSFERGNSGIFGLGRGAVSLINQLRSSIGGKFSYCLVPAHSQSTVSSKLNFGDAAVISGPGTFSTPLFAQNREPFYYLHLEAFSVGRNRIEFGSSSSKPGGNGNIIIDSGTTLTFLPNDVYSKLESGVASAVKLPRAKDPNQVLRLCYKANSINAPVITAHFTGADVILYGLNTFVHVTDEVACLAFLPSQTGAVFGNLAQQNILVGYDLQKNTVSFKLADCSKQ